MINIPILSDESCQPTTDLDFFAAEANCGADSYQLDPDYSNRPLLCKTCRLNEPNLAVFQCDLNRYNQYENKVFYCYNYQWF